MIFFPDTSLAKYSFNAAKLRFCCLVSEKNLRFKFSKWVFRSPLNDKEVVAVDGKTIRGAKHKGRKSPYHLVSAWADQQNLVLGQVRTDEKSNEIKAIPELLKVLSIEGAIITIDAMGCQEKIADTIIDQKADYLLAVKANQKQLYQDIEDEFRFAKAMSTFTHQDVGHGPKDSSPPRPEGIPSPKGCLWHGKGMPFPGNPSDWHGKSRNTYY